MVIKDWKCDEAYLTLEFTVNVIASVKSKNVVLSLVDGA